MNNKIDYVFIGVGTGGTITGIAKFLKEKDPSIKVIGIDTIGSILSRPKSMNTVDKMYKIEGIGQGCLPRILDHSLIDGWVKTDDEEAFKYARRLIREEGLFVGGSCGSAALGMIKYIKENKIDNENLRCVLFLPDGVRNYMSKYLQDEWMVGNGFIKGEEALEIMTKQLDLTNPHSLLLVNKTIADYPIFKAVPYHDTRMTISDCFDTFKKGVTVIPIRDKGEILGVIEKTHLLKALLDKGVEKSHSCSHALSKNYFLIDASTPLIVIEKLLRVNSSVLVAKYVEDKIQELYCVTQNDIFNILEHNLKEYL